MPPPAKPIFTSEAHKDEAGSREKPAVESSQTVTAGQGFAMDFSPHDTGLFLSGGWPLRDFGWCPEAKARAGNDALIMLAEPVPGGPQTRSTGKESRDISQKQISPGWKVNSEPFKMHKSSVEDVQRLGVAFFEPWLYS